MTTITRVYNPLINIKDEQWISLIDLLTENVFALNGRKLTNIEIQHSIGGHYPAVYFRLTTILEDPKGNNLKTEVSGFVLGFNNEWDDDVYIHPLSAQGFWEDWLKDNSINATFAYHEVGLRKLLSFLDKELNLWHIPEEISYKDFVPNEWRSLAYQPQ